MGSDMMARVFGNITNSAFGSFSQVGSSAAAQGAADLLKSGLGSVSNFVGSGLDMATGALGFGSGIVDPVKAGIAGMASGASIGQSLVSNGLSMGYVPGLSDRFGNLQYINGLPVATAGMVGDGSIGSVAATLGLFTPDEAQLFGLIQDPTQRQMFLIDKRMKQQSLLSSMLTNIMAAKQDVLKEMGRNLRT